MLLHHRCDTLLKHFIKNSDLVSLTPLLLVTAEVLRAILGVTEAFLPC